MKRHETGKTVLERTYHRDASNEICGDVVEGRIVLANPELEAEENARQEEGDGPDDHLGDPPSIPPLASRDMLLSTRPLLPLLGEVGRRRGWMDCELFQLVLLDTGWCFLKDPAHRSSYAGCSDPARGLLHWMTG
jgi:hypothetical protein